MAKYNFIEHYAGPHGPHLSCLTQFTLTRDETKRGGDSIHPRVENGRTRDDMSNTCKTRTKVRTARLIAALSEHCERHPHDMQSDGRLQRLQAIA